MIGRHARPGQAFVPEVVLPIFLYYHEKIRQLYITPLCYEKLLHLSPYVTFLSYSSCLLLMMISLAGEDLGHI